MSTSETECEAILATLASHGWHPQSLTSLDPLGHEELADLYDALRELGWREPSAEGHQ
jgi:hypothetical protein